mgnify:CR=1 FL=1
MEISIKMLLKTYILAATDGPIPKANSTVPIPTVPPKIHPAAITANSRPLLTQAIGKSVTFWRPVIKPSLGPGPRFAIKYNPPPSPVTKTPTIASLILNI